MTTIAFDARMMSAQMKQFGKASHSFLLGGKQAFEALANRLDLAMATKADAFRWGTKVSGEDQPITTIKSRYWKGEGDHHPIQARFSFGWECLRPESDSSRLLVKAGATEITFVDSGNDKGGLSTCFHFDLCAGATLLGPAILCSILNL